MKHRILQRLALVLAVALMLSAAGIAEALSAGPSAPARAGSALTAKAAREPTKVKITKGSRATMKVGGTLTLKAKLSPAGAASALTWTSSDPKVATVSDLGVVKAKKKGTTTVTVKTANGKKAKCTVTVRALTNKDVHALYSKAAKKKEKTSRWVKVRTIEMTGDGLDEALITSDSSEEPYTRLDVLTCKGGKIKTLLSLGDYSVYGSSYYKKTHTLVWHGGSHEEEWIEIYTLSGGKFRLAAAKWRYFEDAGWQNYWNEEGDITKKQYDSTSKKLLKGKKTRIY